MNNKEKFSRNYSKKYNTLSDVLKHPEPMTSSAESIHSMAVTNDESYQASLKASKASVKARSSSQEDAELSDLRISVAHMKTKSPKKIHKKITNHLVVNSNGKPKNNYLSNFEIIVFSDPHIYKNLRLGAFSNTLYISKDNKLIKLDGMGMSVIQVYIEQTYGITPSKDSLLIKAVQLYKTKYALQIPIYNPIDDDLLSKEKWDGKERDKYLFSYWLGAKDNKYTRAVAQKFLCGAVERALHPGRIPAIVPILNGKTGIGKSTLIAEIAGYYLHDKGLTKQNYFSPDLNSLNINNPETQRKLINTWMFELPELTSFRKTDIATFKAFFTSNSMDYRPLYVTNSIHVPIHSVYVGTTNISDYLVDETGNRRFFPVQCATKSSQIKHWDDKMTPHYIYQLWAEAKYKLEKYGQNSCKFTPKQDEWIEKHIRQNFEAYDPLKSTIKQYLNLKTPSNWYNLPDDDKYYYYLYYHSGDKTEADIRSDYPKVSKAVASKSKHPISFVRMNELVRLSSGKRGASPARASRSSVSHKIRLIMGNICDNSKWEKHRRKINGHYCRGWYLRSHNNFKPQVRVLNVPNHKAFKTNNGFYGLVQVGQDICGKNKILGRIVGCKTSQIFDIKDIIIIPYPEYTRYKHAYNLGLDRYF